ncbi:MAG: putative Flavodoxin reductase (ferredoxin-NADPH reductase)putative [Moraxellaceae bacterium]|jgi:ferredoxin-NADP reductase|nr:putative Flavodoxin reductase (ferredoxin-NADPH reductase)putative [Moraxellaceae bacterium]
MLNLIDTALKSPLARILTWPHSPESYLEFLAPEVGGKAIKATVKSVRQETNRAVSLVLQPNHRWKGHVPGQYVSLTVSLNGRRHTRCFTVSGEEQGCPVVTIQSHDGGVVSNWANESVWVGDSVEISAPAGDFILPAKRPERFLLIAGGSGITPVRALLDQLVAEDYAGQVDVLYYVPSRKDAIFLAHLTAVTQTNRNMRLHLVETRNSHAALRGHFTAGHLEAIGAELGTSAAYVCGPAALIEAVEQHWLGAGVADRLTLERFQAVKAPVATSADAVPVEFRDSGVTTTAPGRTLLDAAEGAGLTPTSGCRQGICRTCTCRKLAGKVRDIRTGEISGDGEEDIAICVTVPVTPVTLDL